MSKDHKELEKTLQDKVDASLDESTQICDAHETFKEKESKLCLENETIAKEKCTPLKNFQELENTLKGLQKDLKELNELHDHQSKERHDLWIERAQVHKDYMDLKISKHNIWVECEEHKRYAKF